MTIDKDLALDEKLNPEYFSIIEAHQALLKKANKINNDLITLKLPRLLVWRSASALKVIHSELKLVEKEYLEWNNRATSFLHHPKLSIPDDEYRFLIFSHNLDILRDLRNKLSDNVLLILLNNYFRSKDGQSNQINFIIAITSFALTLAGLVLASLTFIPQTNRVSTDSDNQPDIKQASPMASDTTHNNRNASDSVQFLINQPLHKK